MTRHVALVYSDRIDPSWIDDELPMQVAAFERLGIKASTVLWYDTTIDWSAFDAIVVRSPSDYFEFLPEFRAWIDKLETECAAKVINSPAALRWGIDKARYLSDIAAAGVPTAPTTFVRPGDRFEFPSNVQEIAIKPNISAGAILTGRYTAEQAENAGALVRLIHGKGLTAMVQPYVKSIDDPEIGERTLVFFDGEFSHGIRKRAVLQPGEDPEILRTSHPDPVPYFPTAEEVRIAKAALKAAPDGQMPFAGRVDLAVADDGHRVVFEVEIVDPWLFFSQDPAAADRLALAVQSFVLSHEKTAKGELRL